MAPVTRQDIIDTTACPACDAGIGEPCDRTDIIEQLERKFVGSNSWKELLDHLSANHKARMLRAHQIRRER
jgi:hypothetical protein